MRKLKRRVARFNMQEMGIHHPNKKVKGQSFFAENWRKFAAMPVPRKALAAYPRKAQKGVAV